MANLVKIEAHKVTRARGFDIMKHFSEFMNERDLADSSRQTYKRVIRSFSDYLITTAYESRRGVKAPIKADIVAYKNKLIKENKSAYTISNYQTIIGVYFKWMLSKGYYQEDITENLKKVKIDRKKHTKSEFTKEQRSKMAHNFDRSTLKGKRDYAIYLLLISTGIRVIEAQRADIQDIEYNEQFNSFVLYIQRKGRISKDDFIALPQATFNAINEWLQARGGFKPEDALFCSLRSTTVKNTDGSVKAKHKRGSRLTGKTIRKIIRNNINTALEDELERNKYARKRKKWSAHSLRHTYAKETWRKTNNIFLVRDQLGHESIDTTSIYTREEETQAFYVADIMSDELANY